jgi:3-deoxy-D-manno-octulosonic-acid transferase
MNPLVALPYGIAGQLARFGTALAPATGGKVARSLHARRGIRARYQAWGGAHRDRSRPLLWMHAPSVGEGLQAKPVIALLRARHPALQIAYTFFSPSAEKFAAGIGADFADYLPFDTHGDAAAVLDSLRPTALIFSKLDVWPTLVSEAAARSVRLGMISATLAEESGRSSWLASMLLGDAYRALDAVGTIDEHDGARLTALGVRRDRITVTGDTRYDQVWARAQGADRSSALLSPFADERPTLVAGSTWPVDEAVLLEAWRTVRRRSPGARLIIAPHEPVASHLAPLEQYAAAHGMRFARLGVDGERDAEVVLVDRVGILGDLYAVATVSYVGGGFHAAGLHSVLEPAAFGSPVLFGPRHTASRDAGLLLASGGGFSARSTDELAVRLLELLTESEARAAAGSQALAVVEQGLGAAEKSAALVEQLLAATA